MRRLDKTVSVSIFAHEFLSKHQIVGDGNVERVELTEPVAQLLADDLLSSVSAQAALTGEPADRQNDTPADAANRARPSTVLRTIIADHQAQAPQQDLLGRGLRNVRLVPPVGVEPTLGSF